MSFYQPKSVLVTGGAGFIGSNFIRFLLTHEPAVTIINLDKLTYAGSLENLKQLPDAERHHFIQGDITETRLVRDLLSYYCIDTIVHFAAESHVDRSIQTPMAFVETNMLGTAVLLEEARHYWMNIEKCDVSQRRFHHISTDEVFGSLTLNDSPFTEESNYQPRSPYSASKAGSDHLVQAYYHTYGLPITLSNCSNNYGPYQHSEKFIPTIIQSCLNWQPIPIYGDGKNIRDWLYVDDHSNGILTVIKKGVLGERYNIGGNNEWENIAIAKHICESLDKLRPQNTSYLSLLKFVMDRPGHDFRYAIDCNKIKMELDWSPQETFETGLDKTIQFYLHDAHSASSIPSQKSNSHLEAYTHA